MTILFTGTSTADVQQLGGNLTADTTSTRINSDALEGFQVNQSLQAAIQLPAKHSELWIGFNLYDNGGSISTSAAPFGEIIGLYDSAMPSTRLFGLGVGYNTFAGSRIGYYNGTSFVHQDFMRSTVWNVALMRVDIHMKMADSGGVFDCYLNGTLCASIGISDTNLAGSSGIDVIQFNRYNSNGYNTISGIIVADEDTRAMQFVALPPTAAGATSGWTGLFSDISETGYNDSNLLTTNTLDAISTFVTTDLNSKFATFKIKAVTIGARGIGGESSPTTIKGVVRTGGANFTADPTMGTPLALGPMNFIFGTNPQTGNPWTYAEINAMEFGFKATA